jgi:hypothetical protein
MKIRNTMMGAVLGGMMVIGVQTASAMEIINKDEVTKLLQTALEKGKAGDTAAMDSNVDQALKLAVASIKNAHSFVMQYTAEHLRKVQNEGDAAADIKEIEGILSEMTATGKDTMSR